MNKRQRFFALCYELEETGITYNGAEESEALDDFIAFEESGNQMDFQTFRSRFIERKKGKIAKFEYLISAKAKELDFTVTEYPNFSYTAIKIVKESSDYNETQSAVNTIMADVKNRNSKRENLANLLISYGIDKKFVGEIEFWVWHEKEVTEEKAEADAIEALERDYK